MQADSVGDEDDATDVIHITLKVQSVDHFGSSSPLKENFVALEQRHLLKIHYNAA